MGNYLESREIRIFISSTFKDMQAERDSLVSTVFPLLRHMAAERNVDLVDIDLRWGISEKESHQSKVVEICLDEINKAHPFFIGILGERYGWTPVDNQVDWKSILPERYHDTLSYIDSGLSMTEIEIKYGVLDNPEKIHGGFYLRECDETNVEPAQKKLRHAVQSQTKYPCKTYKTVKELSNMIIQDFTNLLDSLFPKEEADSWETRFMVRKAALLDRTKNYVPRTDVETELLSFIQSDKESACVLTSKPGMGKSATLSKLALELFKEDDVDLIPVFTSDMGHGATTEDIASAVCEGLAHIYDITVDPSISQVTELARLANEIHPGRTLCIIIDGINQVVSFNSDETNMMWWPTWNERTKVIFSAPDDSSVIKDLRRMCDREIPMGKMTIDQRMELSSKYFEGYRKDISPEILGLLSDDNRLFDNTLVYLSLLDEVRRYGDYDTLEPFVTSLASCKSAEELFDRLLEYQEKYFAIEGKTSLLKDVLLLICLSEYGFTENEIILLTGTSRLDISRILSLNRIHLIKRNGRLLFAHSMFEQAVRQRYYTSEAYVRTQRDRIIDFFKTQDSSPRILMEIAYQYYQKEDWDALYKWISDIKVFNTFAENGKTVVFAKYWGRLLRINPYRYDILGYAYNITTDQNLIAPELDIAVREPILFFQSSSLLRILNMLIANLPRSRAAVRFSNGLNKLLENAQGEQFDSFKEAIQTGLIVSKKLDGQWDDALGRTLFALKQGDTNISDPVVSNAGELLLTLFEKTGNEQFLTDAIDILDAVLNARIEKYGEKNEVVAVAYSNLGSAVFHRNQEAGLEYMERSLSIYESVFGHYNVDVAIQYHNIAHCITNTFPDKAIEYAKSALDIYLHLYDEDAYDVLYARYALGDVYHVTGHKEEAIEELRQVAGKMYSYPEMEEDYERVHKILYGDAIACHQYDLARLTVEEAISCTPSSNVESIIRLTADLGALGTLMHDYELMDQSYSRAISLAQESGLHEIEVEMTCYFGKAKWSAGQFDETYDLLTEASNLADEYGMEDSHWKAFALYNRALVLVSQNRDIPQAINDIEQAIEIRWQLVGDEDDATLMEYQDRLDAIKQSMDDVSNTEDGLPKRIQEEIDYMREILSDDGQAEEFEVGLTAFSHGAMDTARNRLSHLMTVIPDDNLSARSMTLRYIAFAEELYSRNMQSGNRQALPVDEILRMYETACNLAEDDENYYLARKISQDIAEYAWYLEDFGLAQKYYFKEVANNLLQNEILQYSTVLALSNACSAMGKQDGFEEYDVELSTSSLALFFMQQGNIKDDELEGMLKSSINRILSIIEYAEEAYTMDFGADCLTLGKYLVSTTNDFQVLSLAEQLFVWAHRQWEEREDWEKEDETMCYYIECQYQLGDYEHALYYAQKYLQQHEGVVADDIGMSIVKALIKTEIACLDIRSAHETAQQYGIPDEWWHDIILSLMPCYGNLHYGNTEQSREIYEYYLSDDNDNPLVIGDLFYFEMERGNRLEAAKYLKKLKQIVAEFGEETTEYDSALTEMENRINN